jgi:coenzyme F420-reducing hydrogenase delta subunit
VTRQSYATEIRIIRIMCTGRVDLAFPLRAFRGGADGVIVGGCWPGECHYLTEGNYDALGNMLLGRKLLERIGVEPERLRLEWVSASEGARFAEIMSDFAEKLRELGPPGGGETDGSLKLRLDALSQLVPWVKLVEREKLRVPERSEEAYREYFGSGVVDRLFDDLIAGKLAVRQILTLLREGPLSTAEIAERLDLSPSDVGKHMNLSSRQGLVRFDVAAQRYALAGAP